MDDYKFVRNTPGLNNTGSECIFQQVLMTFGFECYLLIDICKNIKHHIRIRSRKQSKYDGEDIIWN